MENDRSPVESRMPILSLLHTSLSWRIGNAETSRFDVGSSFPPSAKSFCLFCAWCEKCFYNANALETEVEEKAQLYKGHECVVGRYGNKWIQSGRKSTMLHEHGNYE